MVLSLLKNKNIKGDQILVHIGVGDIHLTFQYFTWCTDTTLKKEFPSFVNVHVVFRPGVGAPHTDELQKLPSIDCLFQPCLLSLWFPWNEHTGLVCCRTPRRPGSRFLLNSDPSPSPGARNHVHEDPQEESALFENLGIIYTFCVHRNVILPGAGEWCNASMYVSVIRRLMVRASSVMFSLTIHLLSAACYKLASSSAADKFTQGCTMCYHVYVIMHIKDPSYLSLEWDIASH